MSASTPKGFVDAAAYLVIEGARSRYLPLDTETGLRRVDGARVVAMRVGRPTRLERDQVAVKVTVRLPAAAFDPLQPTALITVPEDLIQRGPIEVDAADATDGGS
jgi:hypothetical protein